MELTRNKLRLPVIILAALTFNGCASNQRMNDVSNNVDREFKSAHSDISTIKEMPELALIEKTQDIFVSTDAVLMSDKAKRLPAWFQREVSVNKTEKLTLLDVAELITRDIGVKTTLTPDLAFNLRDNGVDFESKESPVFDSFVGFDSTSLAPGVSNLTPPSNVPTESTSDNESAAGLGSVVLRYNGSLSGLLDLVSSRLNVFWRHEDSGIVFYQYDTRSFSLAVIPGSTELETKISNVSDGGEASGGGGGNAESTNSTTQSSSQSTEMKGTFGVWDEMEATLKAMLSGNGSMAISQTGGTITVTDNPLVMKRVEEYINSMNDVMTKQVTVSVKVYNITHSDADSMGVDWNAIYNSLSGDFSIGFNSGSTTGLSGDSSELTATILKPSSPFRDSNAIIRALATQGKVSLVTSASVMTLNNQPVPVQVANQTTYLASSGIIGGYGSIDGMSSQSGTELRPGRVTTGFGMNILPRILDSRQLLMQYSIDLSSLDSLDDIVSGEQRIQAPSVSTRNFMQRVALQSGDTLVLTGFESVMNDYNRTKSLIGANSKLSEKERSMTVIVMTPILTQGIYR